MAAEAVAIEIDDVITPLRSSTRRPSTPVKQKSPTSSKEDASSSMSTSNSNLTEKSEDKKSHSILGLFTRKHPPTTLENLNTKTSSKPAKHDTTPSSSLNFFQRLSWHAKHSPTTHHSPPSIGGQGDAKTPVPDEEAVLLSPTKEMEDAVFEPDRTTNAEEWFESAEQQLPESLFPSEIDGEVLPEVTITADGPIRDATLRSLEEFLDDFRNGRLRALRSGDLAAMRKMQSGQVEVSSLQMQIHDRLTQLGDDFDEADFDDEYAALQACLDRLHDSMDTFENLCHPSMLGTKFA